MRGVNCLEPAISKSSNPHQPKHSVRMGNKRHRSSPGHHPAKAAKQLKIDKLQTTNCAVSKLIAGPPTALNNQFALLGDEMLPITEELNAEPPLPSPAKALSDATIEHLPTHLAEHCLLTAQTVSAIFNDLQRVCHKMNAVEYALGKLTESLNQAPRNPQLKRNMQGNQMGKNNSIDPQKKPQPQSAQHLREAARNTNIFEPTQILLQIAPISINRRRWDSHETVLSSLSQLLMTEVHKIDLKTIKWLPYSRGQKRVQLSFEHAVIPLMLFKMKRFLAKFQITPIRVFSDTSYTPLFQRNLTQRESSTNSWETKSENPKSNLMVPAALSTLQPRDQVLKTKKRTFQETALTQSEAPPFDKEALATLTELSTNWEETKNSLASLQISAESLRDHTVMPLILTPLKHETHGQASKMMSQQKWANISTQLMDCHPMELILLDSEDPKDNSTTSHTLKSPIKPNVAITPTVPASIRFSPTTSQTPRDLQLQLDIEDEALSKEALDSFMSLPWESRY